MINNDRRLHNTASMNMLMHWWQTETTFIGNSVDTPMTSPGRRSSVEASRGKAPFPARGWRTTSRVSRRGKCPEITTMITMITRILKRDDHFSSRDHRQRNWREGFVEIFIEGCKDKPFAHLGLSRRSLKFPFQVEIRKFCLRFPVQPLHWMSRLKNSHPIL